MKEGEKASPCRYGVCNISGGRVLKIGKNMDKEITPSPSRAPLPLFPNLQSAIYNLQSQILTPVTAALPHEVG